MDIIFQCNCTGTGFEGPTCNRGLIQTPLIPTLIQNEKNTFNISARPPSDLVIGLNSPRLRIKPTRVTLNRERTVASFEVSGKESGQHTLRYEVSGSISDEFEMPDSAPVLVSKIRKPSSVNNYFRLLKTEPGIVRESCCQPDNFAYSECPMSTDRVVFRSTCAWTSYGTQHETSGVVFAQYKALTLPLSINGIGITYDNSGSISSQLSQLPISSCEPCDHNQYAILSTKPLKTPTCYYYKFDSGDIEDMLRSHALVRTFISRLSGLFPSWFGVSIPAMNVNSFQDIDFTSSLVERDDISSVSGCENIVAENAGLYILLRYEQSFALSIDGNSVLHNFSAEQDSAPVCIAVNLCRGMESPVFLGLPPNVQGISHQLPVIAPYNLNGWQYIIKTVTLYNTAINFSTAGMFWNGSDYYKPDLPEFDLRVNAEARAVLGSSPNSSIEIESDGDMFSYFQAEQVSG